MKNDRNHRKFILNRLLGIWDELPELTLAQIVSLSTDPEMLKKMSDDVLINNCGKYIKVYKFENSLKNKIRKGLKSCVTKLTLW